MQKLAEICIRRPVFSIMLIMALVVVGLTGFMNLGIDRFPSVDLPTVSVRTELPGASPEEIELQLSKPIEEAINTITGIEELRSVSIPGLSVVIITFGLERDIDSATQDVRDRVASVIRSLPTETLAPVIAKLDNDSQPVLTLALSGDRSLPELTEIADKTVKTHLERSAGVGSVTIVGGLARAVNIRIEADRLAAYGINIVDVRDKIANQNRDSSGGNLTGRLREETLRTIGKLSAAKDFNDIVVANINGEPVKIKDIGYVEDGTKEQRSTASINGVPTVTLEIRRQSGANTVTVIEGIKAKLQGLEKILPKGVMVTPLQDQSEFIYSALHEIELHLILGSILASLVVLVFMRSFRSAVIAAVAIPVSVISTFGVMWALHFTLNSVTMLSLVLMVGVVIDDAIVILENIYRFIEEKGMGPFEAARAATEEIGFAVMATTFSLVIIFIPVSFMSSISGRFLYQFGITSAVAVMVSLLVSFSLTPMMSARFFKKVNIGGEGHKSRRGFYGLIDYLYTASLKFSMRHRFLVIIITAALIASIFPLYGMIKQDYLPGNVDEGQFNVGVTAPQGTNITSMEKIMERVDAEIRSVRGVRLVLSTAGGGFGGMVNDGRAYVKIAPVEERTLSLSGFFQHLIKGEPGKAFEGLYSQRDVMTEVRKKLKKIPSIRANVRNVTGFNIGGGNADIDFVLQGPDLNALVDYAEKLRERSEELGLQDADTSIKLDKPEQKIIIDRLKAADLDVDPVRIGTTLRLLVGGQTNVTTFLDPATNENYDVGIRLKDSEVKDYSLLSRLYVPRSGGAMVRLDSVATAVKVKSPSRIDHLDRQREVRLRATIAPGFALADRLEALKKEVEKMNLPPGYSTKISGKGKELDRTFKEFAWAFGLSIIFMYMILASQFESFIHPFTILLSLPLTVPFALLSIYLTDNTLNLYSALGILVLFGVVKKNAILQIDHMNNLRAKGLDLYAAVIEANRDRLRPILMTTLTFVAGMVPLALGAGPGAEERRVIAVVIIGGQTLSLFLTLLATPVVYSLLDDFKGLFLKKKIKNIIDVS